MFMIDTFLGMGPRLCRFFAFIFQVFYIEREFLSETKKRFQEHRGKRVAGEVAAGHHFEFLV